jgi:hypothetical protein
LDLFFENIRIMCLFPKREFICLKLLKFSTASTRMIRIEAGSSIPYLGFHWDLSSSLKSVISEAGLYNIIPNIPFYCKSARCFNILLFQSMGVS